MMKKLTTMQKSLIAHIGALTASLISLVPQTVLATQYGENIKEWISGEALALGLVVIIGLLVFNLVKRNWTGVVVTIVAGGITLFFVAFPEKIIEIGKTIAEAIFN